MREQLCSIGRRCSGRTMGPPTRMAWVGAGFSPRQGLRIGVAGAWGRSGNAETSDPYTLLNIEGE